MTIVDEPPARPALWWRLVAVCALILLVAGTALTVWWALSRETRTTTYRVLGELAAIRRVAETDPSWAHRMMQHWLGDPDLASVRESDAIERLPVDARDA